MDRVYIDDFVALLSRRTHDFENGWCREVFALSVLSWSTVLPFSPTLEERLERGQRKTNDILSGVFEQATAASGATKITRSKASLTIQVVLSSRFNQVVEASRKVHAESCRFWAPKRLQLWMRKREITGGPAT